MGRVDRAHPVSDPNLVALAPWQAIYAESDKLAVSAVVGAWMPTLFSSGRLASFLEGEGPSQPLQGLAQFSSDLVGRAGTSSAGPHSV